MPETRRNKRKYLRGGMTSEEESTIRTTRLLLVNNALEATVLGGANLFSAPEWTVVCNSGGRDGGEKLFYKNMSKMGIYDYYYGYGANNSVLKKLACKSWCLLATTNSELVPLIQDIFMQEPHIITISDSLLSDKLNRYKTVLVKQNEKLFEREEQRNQTGGLLSSDTVGSIQNMFASIEKPEVFAEFLTRDMFTVKDILKKMNEKVKVKTSDGVEHEVYNNILYLPETSSNRSIDILKTFLANPFSKQMDMMFFDNRSRPTIPEQYFYKIDLDEPIIIRTNDITRKMIAFLNSIDELETLFSEGYQFLSSLRITPLSSNSLENQSNQQGGQFSEITNLFDGPVFDEMDISQNPFIALTNSSSKQSVSDDETYDEYEVVPTEQPSELPVSSEVEPILSTEQPSELPVSSEVEPILSTEQPILPAVSTIPEQSIEQPILPAASTITEVQPLQQGGKQKRRTIKQRKYKANSH